VLEKEQEPGQEEVYASHSLHEITMYYPMRAIRTKNFKLIYNVAHELTFPMALDLVESSTWQSVRKANAPLYGEREISAFLHRPRFELYNLEKDPGEKKNLAADPEHRVVLMELMGKLKAFQQNTNDPWVHKWVYE
jgi:N-sulfoglucosamine sulfohydrolase